MDLIAVAQQFRLPGAVLHLGPYGGGNVNDTYLVVLDSRPERYLLQRLNPAVFAAPRLLMANLRRVLAHMADRLCRECGGRRWELPDVVPLRAGGALFVDADGACWRLLRFIEQTRVCETVTNHAQALQVGCGLGRFHRLVSDLPPAELHDTLPGFHVTPTYLAQYDALIAGGRGEKENDFCRRFIEARRDLAPVLERQCGQGQLPLRVMHGDPKVNNFLLDEASGRVVSLVDLDTVKPGLVQYDLGDCLRSCCNPAGEEASDPGGVDFDTDCCRAILQGYLAEAAVFLVENDYAVLYDAVRLITFELGLRFYTDALAGNRYFKAVDPEHNLRRAMVQFRLVERIEARERAIRAIVDELR